MKSPTTTSPTIDLEGRHLYLISGARTDRKTGKTVEIETIEQLVAAAQRNPDAVAFGYVAGRWVAGA